MSASIAALVRGVARGVGWVLLAIVGGLAAWVAGWVPPELAAMLGSQFSQGRPDPASLPAPDPPAARVTRRGTPRTTGAGARSQNGRRTRTLD